MTPAQMKTSTARNVSEMIFEAMPVTSIRVMTLASAVARVIRMISLP
jgi:hypothetical protein